MKLLAWIRMSACCLGLMCGLACSVEMPPEVEAAYAELPEEIDFNFHVRPILSDRCFACHGPDENSLEAELRLDREAGAFAALSSGAGHAIVKGNANKSVLVERILNADPEIQMPPPESQLKLTDTEKAILIKWIKQGAKWKKHWSFLPPEAPTPPELTPNGEHQPIDRFIRASVLQQGLTPGPEADSERLLRRVTMDLTGLPPTLEEIAAFQADTSPGAYERVVDRLLETDAHAERMAMDWMDIARYADSHGLHADGYRIMWPWRDWVIRAFRENMPYDQFGVWQLAGDLMPDTGDFEKNQNRKLATAFHRNHPMTSEGGAIPEEGRLNHVFDRTETTATAFMGLTLGCARCHTHKFDPITQDEYYQMAGFFNNVEELGMSGNDGNFGPLLSLHDARTETVLDSLQGEIDQQERAYRLHRDSIAAQLEFVKEITASFKPKDLIHHYRFDRWHKTKEKIKPKKGEENKPVKYRDIWVFDQYRPSRANGEPVLAPGKVGKAILFEDEYTRVELKEAGLFELTDPFTAEAWIQTTRPKDGQTQTIMGNTGNKNQWWRGWDLKLDTENRLQVRLISSHFHNSIQVRTLDSLCRNEPVHVAITYDGSGKAAGIGLYVNGEPAELDIVRDELSKSILPLKYAFQGPTDRPLRLGSSYSSASGDNGVFQGWIDEVKLYKRELAPFEVAVAAGLEPNPSPEEWAGWKARTDRTTRKKWKALRAVRTEKLTLQDSLPVMMVMEEMQEPRPMFVYNRGEYDAPMHEVLPGTPAALPPFPDSLPRNRLGLAQWLFDGQHPLTARVTVNRYWQMLFGKGLVKTPQDFGLQGALPSHPELLDWLAARFVEEDWNLRWLLKTIVMSATYRQSSAVNPIDLEKDPENTWLARGPAYRLPAEMIRDNALAASGLLVREVGGHSVKPYQPDGLWIEKTSFSPKLLRYKMTKGDSLYRRSLYTFIRRTVPHPVMTAFDAPNRTVCTVKRENTNTPLQALVLLNETQFVEAARAMAEKVQRAGCEDPEAQIEYAFVSITSRLPKPKEVALLSKFYASQRSHFEQYPAEADSLMQVGESPFNKDLEAVQTAALTMVTNTIFNHDEAYMKR